MQKTKGLLSTQLFERLYLYSLLFFVVLLPFQFTWLPLTLGLMLFALLWLVRPDWRYKWRLFNKPGLSALFLVYYLWVVIGGIYSPEKEVAERILILKIPFAAWAILLTTSGLKTSKAESLVSAFILSLGLGVLYAVIQSGVAFLYDGQAKAFNAFFLLRYYNVSPHYFGLYLNLAYGLLLSGLFRREYILSRRWLSFLLLLLMVAMVMLLAVRMQYLVFVAVTLLVIFLDSGRLSRAQRLSWLGGAVAVLLIALSLLPGPRQRIIDSFNELVSFKEMVDNKQTNPRKFLWRDGIRVIVDHWLIGTGTGAEDAALYHEFKDEKALFWDGRDTFTLADTGYNYHNAYLQHWAAHGLVGFAILVLMFLVPLWRGKLEVRQAVFLMICALSFLTESMLQRQAGVLFFSFFYGVFFFLPDGNIGTEKNQATEHNDAPVSDKDRLRDGRKCEEK